MSIRLHLWGVPSLDPLFSKLGSNDESLVQAVVDSFRQEVPPKEIIEYGRRTNELICKRPAGVVQDEFHCMVLQRLAEQTLGLSMEGADTKSAKMLENGFWKYQAWAAYTEEIESKLDDISRALLKSFLEGRPVFGNAIECESPIFSLWLRADELQHLSTAIDAANLDDPDGLRFQGELRSWLKAARAIGELWVYAE